jgi:hypothetical protein
MQVCVFVETFEIFTYICAGRQLSNNITAIVTEVVILITIKNIKYCFDCNRNFYLIYV